MSTHAVVLGNFTLPNIEITKKAGVAKNKALRVGARDHISLPLLVLQQRQLPKVLAGAKD